MPQSLNCSWTHGSKASFSATIGILEPTMLDPFKLFFRLLLLLFKIIGYSLACGVQAMWYVAHGKNELVGDAIGYLGRDITNAISDVFRR